MNRRRLVLTSLIGTLAPACAAPHETAEIASAGDSPRAAARATTPPAHAQELAELKKEAARAFDAGEWPNAAGLYEQIVALEPANAGAWFRRGFALHSLRDFKGSAQAFERSNEIKPNGTVAYDVACARAQLGETDAALAWLEKSKSLGMQDLATLTTDHDLDPLRSSPRFQELVKAVQDVAQPCANRPESRQFDFWIGEWDVTDTAGNKVGDSRIERILDGCVLLENWTGARGGTGKSFNLYDSATKAWKQTWCDSRGDLVEFHSGKLAGGAMVFLAESNAPAGTSGNGRIARRLSFFDLGPNDVRQFAETSDDGGTTWKTEYDFHYHRKGAKT